MYARNPPIITHTSTQDLLTSPIQANPNLPTPQINRALHTPPLKPSSHLPYRRTPIFPPPKQTGPTTLKQSGDMIHRNSACFARLSKAPYYYSYTHCSTPPLSKQTSHLPTLIRQPHNVRNKTQWQAQLTAPHNTDLQSYDKICAHLHRLHTRMKT